MSEPKFYRPRDFAVPSEPGITRGPAPVTVLDGSDLDEAIEAPSDADGPRPDSNVDTAIDIDSVVGEIPSAEVDIVPILPGIDLSGDIQVFHRMLEGQVRDDSWALPMEAELYDYFFQNSLELADNFGVPNVVCRATICEIQAIGYGQGSLEAWQAATSDLDSQPWAEEFIQVQLGGNQIGRDAEGLVLVLIRASRDATVQSIGESAVAI